MDISKNEEKLQTIEESQDREKWDRKIEFIFSCIGFAVGYGNFWRFPFKCFKNGGGAFLIPFIICLTLAGIPLFFLEVSIGQYTQGGPLTAWRKICPLFSGIGYSMMIACFLCSVYYNVILAWSCYYLFNSFIPDIPWVGCNHTWNSENCFDPFKKQLNNSNVVTNSSLPSPSLEFFTRKVLQLTAGIEQVGSMNWQLALCLLLAWVMVYFCIWKGIRTTGKVVYFTALFPYVMLLILFVNGLLLEGSGEGIKYYITPQWHKLAEPEVWIDAAAQVFFSITIGFGVMLTFASYNPVHNNIYRDAMTIALSDALTSIFSGFVVFSILGYMAHTQGKKITDPSIATDGPGLVFVVYPAALATLPAPHFWAVVFFLMLVTLGLDSQFGQVELICACLIEEYPKKLKKHKEIVVLIACMVMFLFGLTCVTGGGMYVFHLLDSYAAGISIFFLGIVEVFAIAWIYGAGQLKSAVEFMIGRKITGLWVLLWKYLTPTFCLAIFVYSLVGYKPLTYESTYVYPVWANVLGWFMIFCVILCVPLVAAKQLYYTPGSILDKLKALTSPKQDPKDSRNETEMFMLRKDRNTDHLVKSV